MTFSSISSLGGGYAFDVCSVNIMILSKIFRSSTLHKNLYCYEEFSVRFLDTECKSGIGMIFSLS